MDILATALSGFPVWVWPLAAIGLVAALFLPKGGRRRATAANPSLWDPKVQLAAVRKVGFTAQPLFNTSEAKVFAVLQDAVQAIDPALRVMGQVNLGEILTTDPRTGTRSEREAARRSINSKRLDFAVFDAAHRLVLAIEYQGAGHYSGTAKTRDAVKKAAFDSAQIPLLAIFPNHSAADIRGALHKHLGPVSRPAAGQQAGQSVRATPTT